MEKKRRTLLPDWVKEQQHQSWQIEILIASGLIFFLIRIPKYLGDWFVEYTQATEYGAESVILIVGALYFSKVLLIGFSINLLLRSLWLAYLGVNFVYPNDINYDQLRYSKYFKDKMEQRADSVKRIIQLEHFSSLSYSMTLMLTVMAVGIFLLLSLFYAFLKKVAYNLYDSQDFGIFIMVVFLFFSLGILDFVFFRLFKKSRTISKWFYPIHRVYNLLSLSFLFKREWLVLISNGKRWVIYPIFVFFFAVAFFMAADDVDRYIGDFDEFTFNLYENRAFLDIPTFNTILSNRYDNLLNADRKIESWCLNSDVMQDKSAWVFVVYYKWMDTALEKIMGDYTFQRGDFSTREEVFENDRKFSASISKFLNLNIDSTQIVDNQWFYHRHTKTQELGFKTYVPLDSVSQGHHKMHLNILRFSQDSSYYSPYRSIPFFKE